MKKIFTLYFFFLCASIQAQTFTNYTTAEGLINNSVNCLAIDADDHVWFGTQEGLSYFDGTTWTNYDVNSHPDLLSNTIKALAIDHLGNLWIGTDFGVNKFDGTNWTSYTEADGLADNRIKYIKEDAANNIWLANNDGFSIFDVAQNQWTSFTMTDGLPFGGTNFVTFDPTGNAYLGTPLAGVYIYDGTNLSSINEDDGLLNDKVRSIAIDADNNKWIASADGISVFDVNNEFVTHHEIIFELPPPDELNPVEDIQIDSEGRIWAGIYVDYLVTEGGVSLLSSNSWQDFDVSDGLVGPVVRRLAIDAEDVVWVATSTGVTKITDIETHTFDLEIDHAVKVYPNPVVNTLTLDVPSELIGTQYQIHNATGILITEGRILQPQMNLDVKALSNGFYFLSIDQNYQRKLVLMK